MVNHVLMSSIVFFLKFLWSSGKNEDEALSLFTLHDKGDEDEGPSLILWPGDFLKPYASKQ